VDTLITGEQSLTMEGISSSRRGGEDVVIARDGVPLVRLVPVADSKPRPLLGLMKEIWIADDFDAPLDDFSDYR
jgi:antitoxin (DNA-binding transcriptional repressor) of toxin-antitoxin stability system